MIIVRAEACLAALIAGAVFVSLAHAENYPAKPVRIVVPNEAGGVYDFVGRLLAAELSARFPQRFYVENKPGGGSIVGTQFAAHSAPDGYTLLMGGPSNIVFNAALYRKLSYDPLRDFVPVALINKFAYLLVSRPDLPHASLTEILNASRKSPGSITIAAPGVGSAPQILGAALMKIADARFVEIPYKGVQAPLTDMLASRIDLMFASESAATPYIRDGRIKAIATSDTQRSRALSDLPTLLESGTNLSLEAWLGLFAPANVPPDVLMALRTQVRASLPSIKTRLAAGANELMDLSPEATDTYLRRQYDYWTKLIGSMGITLD